MENTPKLKYRRVHILLAIQCTSKTELPVSLSLEVI